MILFEKSIVLAATFLLIILFIGYLGISIKRPNRSHLKETFDIDDNSDNSSIQQLKEQQNNFEKQVKKQLQQMQKQITSNANGVNDYLKNKNKLQKSMKKIS